MSNFEPKLAKNLYRAACPDSLELGEYHLGLVAGKRKDWIQAHLGECRFCAAEIAQLQGFLDELKPDLELSLGERASSRVQTWLARLLPEPGQAAPGLAGMGLALRGTPGALLSYEAGEAQLHLEVQADPGQAGRRSLLGLLLGVSPAEVRAWLFLGSETVRQAPLDELSNFSFPDIPPDEYTLLVRGPEFEIIVGSLPIL